MEWVRMVLSSSAKLGSHSNDSRRSELKESQPGYALEVAQIRRQHRIAERERGRTDQEIGERNHDAAALLLGVQLAGQLGDVRRQGINDDGRQEILDDASRRARRSAVFAR